VDQEEQARRPVAKLSVAAVRPGFPARERGWVGLVVILIALVIVALLAQKLLHSYGLPDAPTHAGARLPPAASPAAGDAASAPAVPTNPMQRARGLEQQLQRDAQDQAQRIDAQTH
jgi:hypothetical protein